jgi:hypothetical protein
MAGPHHRTREYRWYAPRIVARANADPTTLCGRCGRTLDEHTPHRNGRPARWTAGHVNDGELNGPLRPEASTCNLRAGGWLRFHPSTRSEEWYG